MKHIVRITFCVLLFAHCALQADDKVTAPQTTIEQAYRSGRSNLLVTGEARVIRLLPDDNHNSRHQRFIVRLPSGQTLLIAHNIDLAAKISDLHTGDIIGFLGEYVWGQKGGTVHWTHHDPSGHHVSGWLKHAGKLYQ